MEVLYLVEFCELFVKCFMCFNQCSVSLLIPATREGRKQEEREEEEREEEGREEERRDEEEREEEERDEGKLLVFVIPSLEVVVLHSWVVFA